MTNTFRDLKKNMDALRQLNITIGQMPAIMREFALWRRIIWNLKELEGSWTKAFSTFAWMFKGVPKKEIPKTYDPYSE